MGYDKPWYQRSKFWVAVVSGLLIVANEGLNFNLPAESMMAVAGVVIAYILGQSQVDKETAKKN